MSNAGHRQRLRARFKDAPEKPADYELLELLLGYVHLRRDTKSIAKALLQKFGSLNDVLYARPDDLESVDGVGPAVADFFLLLKELPARMAEDSVRRRKSLCNPEAVARMARQRLGKLGHEEVWVAFVDNNNRLIEWEKATRGTPDASTVYPREIVARALEVKATGFILVHNHPGGMLKPSAADLRITQRLRDAANALEIRFLDHIIVTENRSFSLMTESLL